MNEQSIRGMLTGRAWFNSFLRGLKHRGHDETANSRPVKWYLSGVLD